MVDPMEHQETSFNNENVFRFDCGEDWARIGADFSHMCQVVGDQLRRALAEIDLEGLRREIKEALGNAAADIQRANERWPREEAWSGTRHGHGDVSTSSRAEAMDTAEQVAERMTVLRLIAQGKITAEEGARLLDALGD